MWIVLPCAWMTGCMTDRSFFFQEWDRWKTANGDPKDAYQVCQVILPMIDREGFRWEWSIPWAIPAVSIGTIWSEDALAYDPDLGLWTLEGLVDDLSHSLTHLYFRPAGDRTFTMPEGPAPDPRRPAGTGLSEMTLRLYRDYLTPWYAPPVPPPVALSSSQKKDYVEYCTRRCVRSTDALQDGADAMLCLRAVTVLETLLRRPPQQDDWDEYAYQYTQVWRILARTHLHKLLPQIAWPPPSLIRHAPYRSYRSFGLPLEMLLHAYWIDPVRNKACPLHPEIFLYWTDPQIGALWNRLDGEMQTQIERNLLYYLPTLGDPRTDMPITLPDSLIPRLGTRLDADDPLGDRYRVFNPSLVYDPSRKTHVAVLRTANYDMNTYRSRDGLEPSRVMTRNFGCAVWEPYSSVLDWKELTEGPSAGRPGWEETSGIRGLEDIRLFHVGGECFFLANACDRVHFCPTHPMMPLCVMGRIDWDNPEKNVRTVILDYGHAIEKNWAPIVVDGNVYAVYSYDPFVLLDLTPLVNLPPDQFPTRYRPRPIVHDRSPGAVPHGSRLPLLRTPFRGSGGFLHVPEWDARLGVVHQVVFTHRNERKYYHRFVCLRTTPEDIELSFSDPFVFHGSQFRIEYALGIVKGVSADTTDEFWIPFSTHDERPCLRRIDRRAIETMRWSVSRQIPRWSVGIVGKEDLLPPAAAVRRGVIISAKAWAGPIVCRSCDGLVAWVRQRLLSGFRHCGWSTILAARLGVLMYSSDDKVSWVVRATTTATTSSPFWFTQDGCEEEEGECPAAAAVRISPMSAAIGRTRGIIVHLDRIVNDIQRYHRWAPLWSPGALTRRSPVTAATYLRGWPSRTYWINRSCDGHRRFTFLKRMNGSGIPTTFRRIEAVNGDDPAFDREWPLCRYVHPGIHEAGQQGGHQNRRTLALTLSHFKALETARRESSDPQEWVMIMEDDACLDHLSMWPCPLADVIDSLTPAVGLCSLARLFPLREEHYSPAHLTEPIRYYGTTLTYIVRIGAIDDMLTCLYKHPPPRLGVSDRDIFRACHMEGRMTRFPFFTFPIGNDSTLHHDHVRFQTQCQHDFQARYFGVTLGGLRPPATPQ